MHEILSTSIEKALSYIMSQRSDFYGEAWDIHFGDSVALVGNQFGVSLILDALLDAVQQGLLKAKEVREDIARLANTMKDGGWRYFPEFDLIPPDADDTSQMVQLLARIHEDVSTPVSLLLSKQNFDGSFKTWLQGASDADIEVTANVLYALHLVDRKQYLPQILRGTKFLASKQESNGWWKSTWYYDKYYGAYVCLRVLSRLGPSSVVEKAQQFLLESQNEDGGWGSHGSTAKDTAFSLLSLPPNESIHIERGVRYLITHQQVNGSWDAHPFYYTFGSKDKFDHPIIYRSRTVTTAQALKALLHLSQNCRL